MVIHVGISALIEAPTLDTQTWTSKCDKIKKMEPFVLKWGGTSEDQKPQWKSTSFHVAAPFGLNFSHLLNHAVEDVAAFPPQVEPTLEYWISFANDIRSQNLSWISKKSKKWGKHMASYSFAVLLLPNSAFFLGSLEVWNQVEWKPWTRLTIDTIQEISYCSNAWKVLLHILGLC